MGFKRYATAQWEGDLKSGKGAMSTPQSGLFDDTRAEVLMETGEAGPSAVGVNLIVSATVPGLDAAGFAAIADNAKKNCVISRALAIPVNMEATLLT